jgi:cephalosporin-C deacetylase-like acetyl esterase
VLVVLGCEQPELRVRLGHGEDQKAACEQAIGLTRSFYVELSAVDDVRAFKKCVELSDVKLHSLIDLERALAGRVAFRDVPPGGSWTIWVQGFDHTCCRNQAKVPLLCGVQQGMAMPEDGGEIVIGLQCLFIKESEKSCRCSAPSWCPCDR